MIILIKEVLEKNKKKSVLIKPKGYWFQSLTIKDE